MSKSSDSRFMRRLRQNRLAIYGGFFPTLFFILVALFGLATTHSFSGKTPIFDPYMVRLQDKLKPPLSHPDPALLSDASPPLGVYLLGTDEFGRDVFARMLEGAIISLSVGLISVGISIAIGILLGALAGYFRGAIDLVIMRFVDVMLCFPTMFLILAILALRRPSMLTVMAVIGLTSWMGTCRLVRAEFLTLRERDFVQAAVISGLPRWKVIVRHILPNAVTPVFVSATLGIAGAILMESGLSYLGFGVPPPQSTWGNILSDGKKYLFDAPHLTYIPGLAIFATVLVLNLGDGLREAGNQKIQS